MATVVPRGFGVKGIDGRDPLALTDPAEARQIIVHLLPANTPLPADTGPYTFHTAIDNQRLVASRYGSKLARWNRTIWPTTERSARAC